MTSESCDRLISVEIALYIAPSGLSGLSFQIKLPLSQMSASPYLPIKNILGYKQDRKESRGYLSNISLSTQSIQRRCMGWNSGFQGNAVSLKSQDLNAFLSCISDHIPAWISSWLADVHLSLGLIYAPTLGWSEEGG